MREPIGAMLTGLLARARRDDGVARRAVAVAALLLLGGAGAVAPAAAQVGRGCSVFNQCDRGYSCHTNFRCYNDPRREGQPCSVAFQCGRGLSCGVDLVCHRPAPPVVRGVGASCVPGIAPCGPGLNCGGVPPRCVRPGGVGDVCDVGRPCGGNLGCGSDFRCHQPGGRRAGESCTPGIEPCANGLNCGGIPGRCVPPGGEGDVCDISRPCRSDLNCSAGIPQLCHRPGIVGETCHATRPCGNGLTCQAIGAQGLFKCAQDELDVNSNRACGALYAQPVSELARRAGTAFTWGAGGSATAGIATGNLETGVAYGPNGQFGCYATVCAGVETPGFTISAYAAAGIYSSWDRIAGLSFNTNQSVTASRALTAVIDIGPGFNISQVFDTERGLIGTTAGFSMNLGVSVVPIVTLGAAACCTVVIDRGSAISAIRQGINNCATQATQLATRLGSMFGGLVRGQSGPTPSQQPVNAVPAGQAVVGSIGVGSSVSGSVSASTPVFEGRPTVFYDFQCAAGQSVQLNVTSTWDNVAFITDMAGNRQAYADDVNGANAQINWTCPASGSYRAGAGAYSAQNTGSFTMSLQSAGGAPPPQPAPQPQPQPSAGQAVVGSISIGATVGGSIDGGTPRYANRPAVFYNFQCGGGQALRLNVTAAYDNVAFITDLAGNQLAFNDDANGSVNAQIDWTCPSSGTYRAGAGAYSSGQGSFTMSLQSAGGAPPPQPAPQPGGGQSVVGSMSVGATVGGSISGGTPQYANRPAVFYNFQCSGGQALVLNVNSTFDNVAFITDMGGNQLSYADDVNGTNAQINWTCPASGTYRAGAGAYSAANTGAFTISLHSAGGVPQPQPTPQPSAGGAQSVVGTATLGATLGGTLNGGGPTYAGRPAVFYNFQCSAGQGIQVNVNSQFDNVAFITDMGGNQLAFNDDANGTLNAQINWRCPASGMYRAGAGALRTGLGGPFTIRVTSTGGAFVPGPDRDIRTASLERAADAVACRVPASPGVAAATCTAADGQCRTDSADVRPGRIRTLLTALLSGD